MWFGGKGAWFASSALDPEHETYIEYLRRGFTPVCQDPARLSYNDLILGW